MTNTRSVNKARRNDRKVAIVHDWLPLVGGAERVLEQLLEIYPDAEIFTLFDFVSRADAPFLIGTIVICYRCCLTRLNSSICAVSI